MSQDVKGIRQWNLFSQKNITWKVFLLKNHSQNVTENQFSGPFVAKLRTTKYIETTVCTTCFYLIQSFLKKREGFWK